ncbi:pilus assembly protein [Vibrio cidicii]|nr:pilus assembly protein [Vibrio cidicii]
MIKRQKGALTVEVAMGLPILLMMCFSWVEICLLSYSMSISDHALTVSVIRTKKLGSASSTTTVAYQKELEKHINQQGGVAWKYLAKEGSVKIHVDYFKDYQDFVICNTDYEDVEQCPKKSRQPKNMAIAMYRMEYTYNTLFDGFLPDFKVRRELMAIQEYERCAFKIGQGAGCES